MIDPSKIRVASYFLVPGLLLAAVAGAMLMVWAKPDPERVIPEVPAPLVRIQEVSFEDVRLTVESQGTVRPRTESQLVPEVSGQVVWVSDAFEPGGYFRRDEILLRIDDHDYRQAVILNEAEVARAKLVLAQEEAEAEVAREEWEALGEGDGSPLTLRELHVDNARAMLAAAEAALERSRRNRERTEIRTAYDGRVLAKQVDLGQFVTVGAPVGSVYALNDMEVRLPLPDRDLAYLDLPLAASRGELNGPKVYLRADFAGEERVWEGRVVRTEGEVDPTSRLVHLVARVRSRAGGPDDVPLVPGMYVRAEIVGRDAEDVIVLPRSALRGRDEVMVVDADERIRFREVDVLRATTEEVLVRDGLAPGERVCLTQMEAVTDGMQVRIRTGSGA